MENCDYDVLVIGGGPAGSTAAALARQRGFRVALVEKERFPRFKIGESLLPNGNAILRESGAWPKVEAAGFVKKFGAYFFLPDGDAQKEVIFSEGLVPGLETTFQVDRARFDQILLEHAAELGAEVFQPATVTKLETGPEATRVSFQSDGQEKVVTARWILDAGGRDNLFTCDLKRRLDPPSLEKRVALYAHYRGVHRAEGRAAGHTIVIRLEQGWFWVIPIGPDETSVGLVTELRALQGSTPADVFRQAIDATPRLRRWLRQAETISPLRVTSDYSYFRESLARDRLILLGDSAGFFDPIFSSGVYVAMHSARRAVELVARAAKAGHRPLSTRECAAYTGEIKRNARVFEKLIRIFYDNSSFAIFMSPRPPLRLDRGLNSIVAGHTRLVWPIWWRLQLFLLICRLQKKFRLSPPVSFSPTAR